MVFLGLRLLVELLLVGLLLQRQGLDACILRVLRVFLLRSIGRRLEIKIDGLVIQGGLTLPLQLLVFGQVQGRMVQVFHVAAGLVEAAPADDAAQPGAPDVIGPPADQPDDIIHHRAKQKQD